MQNKIEDLRNHIFAQLERLGDDEKMKNPLSLEKEIKRAKAISELGTVLIDSAKAETDFLKLGGRVSGTGFIPEVKQLGDKKP